MILHPWILVLVIGHSTLLLVFSLGLVNSWQIYRGWDYNSTEEKQFLLEKKTYLVSSVMNFVLFMQILMLFLFAMAVDELADVLPGAMCAVGTLSSSPYGFALLNLKIITLFLYFIWLVINCLDNQIETYPLVRKKYLGLMLLYPLVAAETVLLFAFSSDLDPSVITSCCGSIYNAGTEGWGASLAEASATSILPLFFTIAIVLLLNRFISECLNEGRKRLSNLLQFPLWIAFFITAVIVIISFISTYVYEMLSHNCPFCFIGAEYHYYGVALYCSLFVATATGMTGGVLEMIKQPQTLVEKARLFQNKMQRVSLWSMLAFVMLGFLPFITYYVKTGRFI